MIVKVEACWGGGEKHYYRLTLPNGKRTRMDSCDYLKWNRRTAIEALDLLEVEFNINRQNVRFSVK